MAKIKSVQRAARGALRQDLKARDAASKGRVPSFDSFVNFAHNLGVGADNAMTSSTYGFNPITRNRVMLEWIHRGSWLGGLAVDVVADDMTREGVEINGSMKPSDIQRIEQVAVQLSLWPKVSDTIKWSRLYGGAVAVMLVDGQDVESPLRIDTIRKGQFCGLISLDRWMVEPSLEDVVTEFGPSLGLPKFYRVLPGGPALSMQKIHHSRVLRLEGLSLPHWQRMTESMWGLSVLERLYDRMIAFDSATTGAAQLVYKSYIRTMKVAGLRELVAAGGPALDGLSAYVDMMRRFQGIEGMTIIDGQDELEAQSHTAFGGLSDALAQFGQQLSGALQIPLVRLFGQSPAGFSSGDSDMKNYYDTINQQQVRNLLVPVTKLYRVLAASEGIEWPDGSTLSFKSLWKMSDEEKATTANAVSQAVISAEGAGLISKATAMKELKQSSRVTGIFSNITDEEIAEAETDPPPMPENESGLQP